MTKENTVAVIFEEGVLSKKSLEQIIKLQNRLQRAIEDMLEDGFVNFILPIIGTYMLFPTGFIDAMLEIKKHNKQIQLIIMLPYEIDKRYYLSPRENYYYYANDADHVIYNQKEYIDDRRTNHVKHLLRLSSAIITYYENYCPELKHITHHAQQKRLPFININI